MLVAAELDNVAIKISGACTLSHKPFPYPDIWEPLSRVFRCLRAGAMRVGDRLDPRR